MTSAEIRIGTSGWVYRDWKGILYPEKLPQKDWFSHFASQFDTVELNFSFYREPSPQSYKRWREMSPPGFVWAIKAHRAVTHYKRLADRPTLNRFFRSTKKLSDKIGVFLFQLPPFLKFDAKLARRFFGWLPRGTRCAFEPRHKTWFEAEPLQLLRDANVALVIADRGGQLPPDELLTADFAYVRFHGPAQLYASRYTPQAMRRWAEHIRAWRCPAYIYFNNDVRGYAIENARQLREFLAKPAALRARTATAGAT